MSKLDLSNKNISDKDDIFSNIKNPENLLFIDLSNNNLSFLPKNLSIFKNLQYLDLRDNSFVDYQNIGLSLSTIPNLEILKIDLSTQENAYFILSQLPNLKFLNDKPINDDNINIIQENKKEDCISLKDEIPNFNSITHRIVNKLREKNQSSELFYSEFQKSLKEQIENINNLNNEIPNYVYSAYVYKSKLEIYYYLQNKCINMLSGKDDFDIINILKDIHNIVKDIYNDTIILIEKIKPKFDEIIIGYENTLKEKDVQNEELNNNLKQSQLELSLKDNYIKEILEENKSLITELKDYQNNKNNTSNKNRFLNLNSNSEENLISKKFKDKKIIKNKNLKKYCSKEQNKKINFENEKEFTPQISYQNSSSNLSPKKFYKDNKKVVLQNKRNLTLKSLLEIINDIYISKFQRDKQLYSNHQQKETLEQHMYSYLNNKYGLKNLISEYGSAIINGIKKYSKENSEVCLFGKVLRNELEEEEILIISKLKNSISDFLYFFFQKKFPFKNKKDIDEMVNKIKSSSLNEELWMNIISFIYSSNENDLMSINEIIQKYIYKNNLSDNTIPYDKFIQILIKFQIRVRDNYLKNFNYYFKKIDENKDGILSEDELIKLIEIMNIYEKEEFEEQIQNMIKELDPYQNGIYIYSDIINYLSKEMLEEENPDSGEFILISLLDKISIQSVV